MVIDEAGHVGPLPIRRSLLPVSPDDAPVAVIPEAWVRACPLGARTAWRGLRDWPGSAARCQAVQEHRPPDEQRVDRPSVGGSRPWWGAGPGQPDTVARSPAPSSPGGFISRRT